MRTLVRNVLIEFQWYWVEFFPSKMVPEFFRSPLKKLWDWSKNEK